MNKRGLTALVAAETFSVLGTRMTYLALPWFVLVTTGSPSRMALVMAAEIVPMALFGIPSGTLVGRLGARATMLLSDAARAPLILALPLLHGAGLLSFPLLLGLVFLLGCFMPPFFAAQRIAVPELVGEDERAMSQANSLIEGGTSLAGLVGPALAGALIPLLSAPNILYVDAATYAVSFLLVAVFVPRRRRLAAPETSGLFGGLRFTFADPLLAPITLTVVGFGFLTAALAAALPVHAHESFGGSARVAGLFFTALGAGALVGSVVAVFAVRRVAPLRLAGLAIAAFALPLWLLPLDVPFWAVAAALFVATFFAPLVNGPIIGVLTARTPEALRPKVMTAVIAVNTAAAPLGFVLAGQVLERWGVAPVFVTVAAGITILSGVFSSIVLRRAGDGAAVAVAAPEPSL